MPRLACPALQITYTGQEKCLPAISSQDPAVRAARQQITAILQQNAQLPEQLCSDFSAQFGELAAVDEIEFLQVTDMLAIAPWQQCQACWSCLPSCTAAAAFALRTQRPLSQAAGVCTADAAGFVSCCHGQAKRAQNPETRMVPCRGGLLLITAWRRLMQRSEGWQHWHRLHSQLQPRGSPSACTR